MRSWRTNLGGAIGTLGTGLSGLATAGTVVQFNGSGNVSKLNIYLIAIGAILSCIGKAVDSLFAADKAEVSKALAEHAAQIIQIKGDTTQLSAEVHGKV